MSWTDERIERLKKMWADGATASQIADELGGVSRNAVIGKAHRLGLEQRPSPVKPGEEKDKEGRRRAARQAAPRAEAPPPRRPPQPRRAPIRARRSGARTPQRAAAATSIQYRSIGPGGFIRQGPGDTAGADPAGPAAPAGPGQAEPRGRRQDQPARPQRPHLQMADGPSRRARLPLLRPAGQPRLSLLRRSIAGSPIRRSSRAATAARRRRCRSAGPGSANACSSAEAAR